MKPRRLSPGLPPNESGRSFSGSAVQCRSLPLPLSLCWCGALWASCASGGGLYGRAGRRLAEKATAKEWLERKCDCVILRPGNRGSCSALVCSAENSQGRKMEESFKTISDAAVLVFGARLSSALFDREVLSGLFLHHSENLVTE